MTFVRSAGPDVVISVRVTPRASKDAVKGVYGEQLRISIASAPVDNQANERLIRFLSERLNVPRADVILEHGAGSKSKTIRVVGISVEETAKRLLD